MRVRDYLYILSLVVIGLFWYSHSQKVVWNLWDDPRACTIAWGDGTYTYKSGRVSLGTIGPGMTKTVVLDWGAEAETINVDSNGIEIIAYHSDVNVMEIWERRSTCQHNEGYFLKCEEPITIPRKVGAVVEVPYKAYCNKCGQLLE